MADLGSLLGAAGIGGAIGQAIVRLELDTSKYSAELRAAQGQTVASTNAMGTSTSKFGQLASSALLGVGIAAVAGAAMSVKAAIEANDAHIKLQNTFANNINLADSSVEAFEAQADSLRDLTGVDDEAIISGQALLGQFKLTGKQVMDLTPLIVDLSAKMGIDLEAAAKAVGKATEGNTGALARYIGTIEQGATPLETYTNITEKLGRVQGFAEERANAEPWRILSAQFEEVAEKIGQALLPAIQGLTDAIIGILPLLEKLASAMQYLPIVQMGEDFDNSGSGVEKFANAVIDTVPILGHFVDIGGEAVHVTEDHLGVVHDLSEFYRGKFKAAIGGASAEITKATDNVEDFTVSLEETSEASTITGREFVRASRDMLERARDLSRALREIRGEDWINPKYLEFISSLGPENLIAFANLNEEKQKKMQDAWEESTRRTNDANQAIEKIIGKLKDLDSGKSTHEVIIQYRYEGFDPSKPGMSHQQG